MKKPIIFTLLFFIITTISSFGTASWIEQNNLSDGKRSGRIQHDITGKIYSIGFFSDLSNSILVGVDLSNIYATASDFSGSLISDSDLSGSILIGAKFTNTTARAVNFSNADLRTVTFEGADLSNSNFEGADFGSDGIIGIPREMPDGYYLIDNYFLGPKIKISGANLTGLDLSGINLSGSNLAGANLKDANLSDTDLSGANLSGADLSGSQLSGATLAGVDFGSGIAGTPASLPNDYELINGHIIGPDIKVSNILIEGADLREKNLNGIELSDSIIKNSNLSGINLSGADLSNTTLLNVLLLEANLENVNLSGANLLNTNLSGANLQGTAIDGLIIADPDDPRILSLEATLLSVENERDALPTQEAYDAVVTDRDSKIEIINDLQSIINARDARIAELEKRPTAEQLAAVEAERDARFVDTDEDGITDVKEAELGSEVDTVTTYYLQEAYDFANGQSLLAGQNEVVDDPGAFGLIETATYDAVVAEKDALFIEKESRFVDSDGDGITDVKEAEIASDASEADIFFLKDAYDFSNAQSVVAGQNEVIADPGAFGLITDAEYAAMVADRDSRFVDSDEDGITDVKEAELDTSVSEETVFYLQDAFDFSNAQSVVAGQNEVIADPGAFGLITDAEYDALFAEKESRFVDSDEDGITDVKEAELESDADAATTFYLQDAYDAANAASLASGRSEVVNDPSSFGLVTTNEYSAAVTTARSAGRSDVTGSPATYSLTTLAAYNAVVAQRDARPTQAAYNAVVAQRDARPTLAEVQDARLGSVVVQPQAGTSNVKLRFAIEETEDLNTWSRRNEVNEVTVPLQPGKRFYRFAIDQ